MKHILLPTDFSDASFNAARFALELHGTKDVEYTFLNVYLKLAYRNALVPGGHDTERASRLGLRRMDRRFRKLAGTVRVSLRSSFSPLADAINEVHAAKAVDLVVMGTQGEGNYGLVGRNTAAAVTAAALPVIAVPAQWQPAKLDRILFADDGEADTAESLQPMIWTAKHARARITVLHVGPAGAVSTAQARRFSGLLGNIQHTYAAVEGGAVERTVERMVAEEGIDLVAVVRRKRSFWHRLFQGSTSKRMALHTTVPLLVLRG
ncbi:MAG: universal stress protein [Flavobacteriales bacterium]|nr:universal stress protein [Flavobacteriales bacterium]